MNIITKSEAKKPLIFFTKRLDISIRVCLGALKIENYFGGAIMNNNPVNRVKEALTSTIDSLFENRQESLYNPSSAFTRVKKISFEQTILFPMVAGSDNVSSELLDLFPETNLPLPSAMIQRRSQVKPDTFRKLFYQFTSRIPVLTTFHGYQLVSCDGSRLNLPYNPSDTDTFCQYIKGRKGINQLHMNALYDLQNDIFLDIVLQPVSEMNEKDAFCQILGHQKEADSGRKRIYLADRGFVSFNIFAHAIQNKQHFLIRVQKSFAEGLCPDRQHWLEESQVDEEVTIHVGRRNTKKNKQLENYHYLPATRRYDFIDAHSDNVDCLNLRVLKFPVSEDTCEYIITNLPAYAFSLTVIKQLYNLRWNQETAFRYLKYPGNMVHIHSLKKEFLLQEIYGKLTAYNFTSCMIAAIEYQPKKTDKYSYAINHTQALKICIRFLKGKIQDLESLIVRFIVPVRPGRRFERNLRRQSADTLAYR